MTKTAPTLDDVVRRVNFTLAFQLLISVAMGISLVILSAVFADRQQTACDISKRAVKGLVEDMVGVTGDGRTAEEQARTDAIVIKLQTRTDRRFEDCG